MRKRKKIEIIRKSEVKECNCAFGADEIRDQLLRILQDTLVEKSLSGEEKMNLRVKNDFFSASYEENIFFCKKIKSDPKFSLFSVNR